jgi:hypothetical protein
MTAADLHTELERFETYCHGDECGFTAWLASGGAGALERKADRLNEEHRCQADHYPEVVAVWHQTHHRRVGVGA